MRGAGPALVGMIALTVDGSLILVDILRRKTAWGEAGFLELIGLGSEESSCVYLNRGEIITDYGWERRISFDKDFLGPAPSYVHIRDPVRRLWPQVGLQFVSILWGRWIKAAGRHPLANCPPGPSSALGLLYWGFKEGDAHVWTLLMEACAQGYVQLISLGHRCLQALDYVIVASCGDAQTSLGKLGWGLER
ncbi:hypothetical protein Tco_0487943 [Tanacetum coccineum]